MSSLRPLHRQAGQHFDERYKRNVAFPFLGAGFANISPIFLISCKAHTRYLKILKNSEQYIRDHLSSTKVRIWIASEYDAAFSFSCTALCNLTKTFSFSCMSFLSYESDPELFKESTSTFYASEILFSKVFVNACKLTGEMTIDWSFFLGV